MLSIQFKQHITHAYAGLSSDLLHRGRKGSLVVFEKAKVRWVVAKQSKVMHSDRPRHTAALQHVELIGSLSSLAARAGCFFIVKQLSMSMAPPVQAGRERRMLASAQSSNPREDASLMPLVHSQATFL